MLCCFCFVVPSVGGAKLLDVLVLLGVFLVSQTKSKKSQGLFWIFGGKPKNHSVFGFFVRSLVKTKKSHVYLFGCLLEPQKSNSLGPLRKVLDFWLWSAFGGNQKPKIQILCEWPETFLCFGFPKVFFQQTSKKSHGFLI